MRFEHPALLWLLLVIPPAMIGFFWWAMRKRQSLLAQFIQARLLPGLLSGISPARQYLRFGCLALAACLLIIALARPQWGFALEEVKQRGLDIVLAIDTSRSMQAEDIAPNRLARAKLAAMDLIQAAKTDRLGLVAFSSVAFLQCPLTFDDGAFRQSLDSLDPNILPQGGTSIAQAINAALPAYREGDNHKVLVLFTDGEDHEGGAVEAAEAAAKADVRIFTIGIGSTEGEVLRARDDSGRVDYVRDDQGNVVKSKLEEDVLQRVASAGNGFYLRLQGSKTMELLYQNGLAPLPRSEGKEKLVKRYHERFHWPLGLAILLILLEILLPEQPRKLRISTIPAPVAALLIIMVTATVGFASPSTALREYKAGNYDKALKQFEDLQKNNKDPRLHFNAGAAAYREGQLEKAIEEFDKATTAKELDLQEMAYYNRGNSRFYLGSQTEDPKAKNSHWQQSLKDFESSLKLNPRDQDALFNKELVKAKIEELKQQQQQQQNQDKNQDKSDDQKKEDQQQQQQQQQDQKQDKDQSKDQQQKDQQQQQQDASKSESKPGDDKKKQEQAQQAEPSDKSEDDKKKEEAQAAADEEKAGDEKQNQSEEAQAPGQMTREQAQRLLDSQKADEKLIPKKPQNDPHDPRKPRKDW